MSGEIVKSYRFLVALTILLALASCSSGERWHQRVTVRLTSPTLELTGSEVRSIRFEKADTASALAQYVGAAPDAKVMAGEAVYIELPDGRFVIALMTGERRPAEEGYNALSVFQTPPGNPLGNGSWAQEIEQWSQLELNQTVNLSIESWPIFIIATIQNGEFLAGEVIDPISLEIPGTDFVISSVSIERTNDPVGDFFIPSLLPCFIERGGCDMRYDSLDQGTRGFQRSSFAVGYDGEPQPLNSSELYSGSEY